MACPDSTAPNPYEAMETRFWSIVDRDGLTGLPSDMWAALDALVKDRAERQRAERNRDMWKGQCQRQAETLRELHAEIERLSASPTLSVDVV